jgi:hypothetical protein
VTPILFESCEDSGVYATAAMESYKDGAHFANYADLALESLAHDVKLVRSMKAKSGESASFSLEADGGIDVKQIVKKAVFAVKAAIQKFIVAIGNFIKSIANWIGSAAVGGQDKLYQEAKVKGLIAAATKSDIKINAMMVIGKREKIFDPAKFDKLAELSDIAERSDPKQDDLTGVYKQVQAILTNLTANGAKGIAVGADGRMPAGGVFAKMAVYPVGAKPVEKPISALASADEYEILSKDHAKAFTKAINTAKKSSAAMAKTLKIADDVYKQVGGVAEGKTPEEKAASKAQMRTLMFQKNIHGFNVSYLLTYYSCYLRERAILARALHMVAVGSKKAAAAKPAAPAKK